MSNQLKTLQKSIHETVQQAIETAIVGAKAEVTGGGGHFQLVVTSEVFAGKSMLESHRLVLQAIAPLMAGDTAPVHAIDSLKTQTP
jgi:acid stress-induced BolA-like protein IbaG/YrbA